MGTKTINKTGKVIFLIGIFVLFFSVSYLLTRPKEEVVVTEVPEREALARCAIFYTTLFREQNTLDTFPAYKRATELIEVGYQKFGQKQFKGVLQQEYEKFIGEETTFGELTSSCAQIEE